MGLLSDAASSATVFFVVVEGGMEEEVEREGEFGGETIERRSTRKRLASSFYSSLSPLSVGFF